MPCGQTAWTCLALLIGVAGCTTVPGAASTSASSSTGGGTCGDDIIQTTEVCEALELRGKTCVTEGFTTGQLTCTADCRLDTSGCSRCGDGVVTGAEICDGQSFNGATCASQGYVSGWLRCLSCSGLDTAGCSMLQAGSKDAPCLETPDGGACLDNGTHACVLNPGAEPGSPTACRTRCAADGGAACGAVEFCHEQGVCFPGCSTADDCGNGESCVGNRCLRPCAVDDVCPFGAYCSARGYCEAGCRQSTGCPDGGACVEGVCGG